jgi:hypothetical protein
MKSRNSTIYKEPRTKFVLQKLKSTLAPQNWNGPQSWSSNTYFPPSDSLPPSACLVLCTPPRSISSILQNHPWAGDSKELKNSFRIPWKTPQLFSSSYAATNRSLGLKYDDDSQHQQVFSERLTFLVTGGVCLLSDGHQLLKMVLALFDTVSGFFLG